MDRIYGGGGVCGNGGVVMTRDPKPRLRWTADLHDRFVDAVTKLGGPDSQSLSSETTPLPLSLSKNCATFFLNYVEKFVHVIKMVR